MMMRVRSSDGFDLEIEALPGIQHGDYFPAQVRDALDELRGLRALW